MVGIFSRFIFNNAIFNTDGGTPTPPDTHDGANADDYKRYRKRLERLAKLSDKHNQSKYIRETVKIAEIVKELPIETPAIERVSQKTRDISNYDLSAIQSEILLAINYINAIINEKLRLEQEQEDELILLMAL